MNNTSVLEVSESTSISEPTSRLSKKNLPCNQDTQGRDELIKRNQLQLNKTIREHRPTELGSTDQQTALTSIADQATLEGSPRHDLNHWDDVEGKFGISTHGPSCHGPRVLLEVIGGGLKLETKVTQLTASTTVAWWSLGVCFFYFLVAHV